MRGPSDAERIMAHVVGGQVRHIQVHCKECVMMSPLYPFKANKDPLDEKQRNNRSIFLHVVPSPIRGALSPVLYCASTFRS